MPGLFAEANQGDYKQAEERLVSEVRNRVSKQVSGIRNASDVHIRDVLPDEDLESGVDNDWNGTNRVWEQSGLEADAEHEVYELDSGQKMEGKVIGFYAVEAQATEPATTEITFEDGTGSRFERLMFQEARGTANKDRVIALLRNPILYNEGKDGYISVWSDDGTDTEPVTDELIFHGIVGEKPGTTLGTRSQTENSPTNTARSL